MTTGNQLKLDGQAAAIAAATVPHHAHPLIIADVLDRTIASGKYFTADDIREQLPTDTAEWLADHGNVLSATIGSRATTGAITAHGWASPRRNRRHGNPNRIWRTTTTKENL